MVRTPFLLIRPGFLALIGTCACVTVTPEQQAVVDKVRVANESGSVSGCQFIRSVTGVERPARWRWEQDVPAITVLQANASAIGGDTVLVTSSATSYRHRAYADRYGSRARAVSFVTMTGDVYRCSISGAQTRITSAELSKSGLQPPPESDARSTTPAELKTGWSTSIDTRARDGSRYIVATLLSEQPGSSLHVSCHEANPTSRLFGSLLIGENRVRPLEPPYEDRSQLTLHFLGKRSVTMSMEVQGVEGSLEFFSGDIHNLIPLLASEDTMHAQLTLTDGKSRTLSFDIRGFQEALSAGLAVCAGAPVEPDRPVFGRVGNATIRWRIVSVVGPASAQFEEASEGRQIWMYGDAEVQGDRVLALYTTDGERSPLSECRLDHALRASCQITEDGNRLVIEIDAHDVRKSAP